MDGPMALTARDDAHTTIDRHPLAGDVFACIRRQQNAQAFEVFIVAQAVQGGMGGQGVTHLGQGGGGQFAGEKPRTNGIHTDIVGAPFCCQARVKLITAPLEVL